MSLFPSLRKLRSKQPLPKNQTRRSTAIRASITPSPGIMGRTTMPRRRRSPTGGQASSYINVCDDHLAVPRFRGLRREKHMTNTNSAAHVRVIEETPGYWRVVFEYPPFNIVDATIFEGLQDLLVRMDTSQNLRVVVFESAIPDFYLAHFDLTGKIGNITTAVGASGLPILMDTFVRLTKSPVVSLAKIRGCVRVVSSAVVLASDMRFASRENTKLGHPELRGSVPPGGAGTDLHP